MRKLYLVVSCIGLVLLSCMAFAQEGGPISTGSEDLDAGLQWLTSIVTIASLVANFTPTKVDNAGVRILSLLINFVSLNWRQLRDAWKGKDALNALAYLAPVLLFVSMGVGSSGAQAATGVQLTCSAPITRTDGSALPAAQISGYTFYKDGAALNATLVPACSYVLALSPGQCLSPDAPFHVTATDTIGQQSALSAVANASAAICRDPAKPSAPTSLTVQPVP